MSLHPLDDDPKVGDHWIFSHPRPNKSLFKRDFIVIEDDLGDKYVVMDYVLWGLLKEFPFETGIWKNGKWRRVRRGR